MDAIREFQKRRDARTKKRADKTTDAVEEYKKRRTKRLESRMDANIGWAYGLAKAKGIDTTGMKPREVFEALEEKGGSSKKSETKKGEKIKEESSTEVKTGAKPESGWKAKAKSTKGVKLEKKDGGYEVPIFDEKTFTDDFEAKKEIAREAAVDLIPHIKKRLSTEVKPIKRPTVSESDREFVRDKVKGITDDELDKAFEEASKIYAYWEEHEPEITKTIVEAVKDIGGTMDGLDNRLKFDKSLAKKAAGDAKDPNLKLNGDIERAAKRIKDGARYTAVFDNDNFAEGYKKVKEALEKAGMKEYRCKNFFSQYKDQDGKGEKDIGEQKSVQCVFETPDGEKFELQFHTPESLAAKEVNHETYKQKKEPPSEWKEFNDPRSWFMRDTSSVVPDPKGVFDIEGHKRGESGYK